MSSAIINPQNNIPLSPSTKQNTPPPRFKSHHNHSNSITAMSMAQNPLMTDSVTEKLAQLGLDPNGQPFNPLPYHSQAAYAVPIPSSHANQPGNTESYLHRRQAQQQSSQHQAHVAAVSAAQQQQQQQQQQALLIQNTLVTLNRKLHLAQTITNANPGITLEQAILSLGGLTVAEMEVLKLRQMEEARLRMVGGAAGYGQEKSNETEAVMAQRRTEEERGMKFRLLQAEIAARQQRQRELEAQIQSNYVAPEHGHELSSASEQRAAARSRLEANLRACSSSPNSNNTASATTSWRSTNSSNAKDYGSSRTVSPEEEKPTRSVGRFISPTTTFLWDKIDSRLSSSHNYSTSNTNSNDITPTSTILNTPDTTPPLKQTNGFDVGQTNASKAFQHFGAPFSFSTRLTPSPSPSPPLEVGVAEPYVPTQVDPTVAQDTISEISTSPVSPVSASSSVGRELKSTVNKTYVHDRKYSNENQSKSHSLPSRPQPNSTPVVRSQVGGVGVIGTGRKSPVSVVLRQPLGPPASVEELGGKNFASRMRKKAGMNLSVLGRRGDASPLPFRAVVLAD